ncbi:MAG: bifunctional precorrin-2 dehydrogenase/sirohydrochlorin ferrochelatase [Bryobacteraceae bacterium]
MNFRYPVFLDVSGKRCLVTGEGFEIPGKVRTLVQRGAVVTYVNPRAEASIEQLVREGDVTWHAREFQPSDLDGCFLVITDRKDNSEIFRLAEERNVLCNAVDDPERCRFSFGSIVSRGDLMLAISTNGIAPALAVRLRERFEKELGEEYASLVEMLGELREEIASRITDFGARRELWYRLVDSGALSLVRQGQREDARRLLRELVEDAVAASQRGVK